MCSVGSFDRHSKSDDSDPSYQEAKYYRTIASELHEESLILVLFDGGTDPGFLQPVNFISLLLSAQTTRLVRILGSLSIRWLPQSLSLGSSTSALVGGSSKDVPANVLLLISSTGLM